MATKAGKRVLFCKAAISEGMSEFLDESSKRVAKFGPKELSEED